MYLLPAEFKRRQREDRWVYKGFIPCFSSEAVQSYLFVVSFVCLHYCTDIFFFHVWIFLFFKILAITEQKQSFTPTLPLFTQKEKDGPPHIAFCPDPRTRSLLHSSRRMTWDVKNVHLYINIISLCFFFSSVLAQQCSWTFFFFSRVWGISSKQAEKGETRVTILQVYDCSF